MSIKTILTQKNSLTIKDIDLVVSTGVSNPDLKKKLSHILSIFWIFLKS